jgi:reelin
VERAQWALDNILIGGAEINPSQLVDTFDDGKKPDNHLEECLAYIA